MKALLHKMLWTVHEFLWTDKLHMKSDVQEHPGDVLKSKNLRDFLQKKSGGWGRDINNYK